VSLNGVAAVVHRPHPSPKTPKGLIKRVQAFLQNAGCEP
jgi:hypothetical protein